MQRSMQGCLGNPRRPCPSSRRGIGGRCARRDSDRPALASVPPSVPPSLGTSVPESLRPSVPPSLRPSVPPSLRPSVPLSLRPSIPPSLLSLLLLLSLSLLLVVLVVVACPCVPPSLRPAVLPEDPAVRRHHHKLVLDLSGVATFERWRRR